MTTLLGRIANEAKMDKQVEKALNRWLTDNHLTIPCGCDPRQDRRCTKSGWIRCNKRLAAMQAKRKELEREAAVQLGIAPTPTTFSSPSDDFSTQIALQAAVAASTPVPNGCTPLSDGSSSCDPSPSYDGGGGFDGGFSGGFD